MTVVRWMDSESSPFTPVMFVTVFVHNGFVGNYKTVEDESYR